MPNEIFMTMSYCQSPTGRRCLCERDTGRLIEAATTTEIAIREFPPIPAIRSQVVAADASVQAENPDLGATAWLLGVRMPRTLTGSAIPQDLTGRVLREAFE